MFRRSRRLMHMAFLVVLAVDQAKAQEPTRLTVCEVFQDLQGWSDKLIAVHGEYDFGGSHGIYAVLERDCPVNPETDGIKWGTAIWLTGSPAPDNLSDLERSLHDPRSFRVLHAFTGTMIKEYWDVRAGPPFKVMATFVGILRAGNLDTLDGGFGYMGLYPAQLKALAVRDIVVTQTSNPVSETPGAE